MVGFVDCILEQGEEIYTSLFCPPVHDATIEAMSSGVTSSRNIRLPLPFADEALSPKSCKSSEASSSSSSFYSIK